MFLNPHACHRLCDVFPIPHACHRLWPLVNGFQAPELGLRPTLYTYHRVLDACYRARDADRAFAVFKNMTRPPSLGLSSSSSSSGSDIAEVGGAGAGPVADLRCYSLTINLLSMAKRSRQVLELTDDMIRGGLTPDDR